MIGNQLKGKDFDGCVRYVLSKPDAQVIHNSTQGQDSSSIALEFNNWCAVNHRVQRKVYHAILSATVEERNRLTPTLWHSLASDYLEKMGFAGVPYLVVEHHDTEHPHIHIVAPRVGVTGKCISDSWDYYRSEKTLRGLEAKYHLSSPPPSRLMRRAKPVHEVSPQSPGSTQVSRYARFRQYVTEVIDSAIATSSTLSQFIATCEQSHVQVQILATTPSRPLENSVKCQLPLLGIAYAYFDPNFPSNKTYATRGSRLGRDYTLKGICDRLEHQELTDHESKADTEVETFSDSYSQWLSKPQLQQLYNLAQKRAKEYPIEVSIYKLTLALHLEPDVARQLYKLTPVYQFFRQFSPPSLATVYLDYWSYGQRTSSEYRKILNWLWDKEQLNSPVVDLFNQQIDLALKHHSGNVTRKYSLNHRIEAFC